MNKKKYFIILLLITFLLPFISRASSLYLDDSSKILEKGKESTLKIMIDTEGVEINTIEGSIMVDNKLNIKSIDTGGSAFVLWPEEPKVSSSNTIIFAGGVFGGIYGKDLRVFDINFIPQENGVFNIKSEDVNIYLSDGSGNKVAVNDNEISFQVVDQKDNKEIIEKDSDRPTYLTIELGRDESLFDGQYFITFYAIDSHSGIDRYEVKEGSGDFIDYHSNKYVLKDQTLKTNIYVKAIDKEGNETTEVLKLEGQTFNLVWIIVSVIVLILLSYFIYLKFLKKKNEK